MSQKASKTTQPAPVTDDSLHVMRHSLAHILATAIQELHPHAKFGVGPVVDNGFYYDVDIDQPLTPEDLERITKKMRGVIAADYKFERSEVGIDEAIERFTKRQQPYKVELLNDLKTHGTTVARDIDREQLGTADATKNVDKVTTVSLYTNGPFEDLCRGPHLESTGKAGAFKLTKVSGAYWRGNAENPQMQRVYGVAFATENELNTYVLQQEEAEKRDHRKLGRELDLFVFSASVGSGLPLFTPRGTHLREQLNDFSQQVRLDQGFEKVWIPHLTKTDLYKTSGHLDKFGDELFLVKSQETKDQLVLKPMNCPHHQQIYASRPRSYRELPIKYLETTTIYRDEKAGELLGLSRVRSVTQDDSHVFCTPEQIDEVIDMLIVIVKQFYEVIGMDLKVRLSLRDDGEGYLGEPELWQRAEAVLRKALEHNGLDYFEAPGEAAFYGPKIDFLAIDALGREWQVATPQLDFVQPQRFGLEYIDADGAPKTPVMIHFALLGSIERFLSVYIEHTAGNFPVWLAPEQVRLATVNDDPAVIRRSFAMLGALKAAGIRVKLDNSAESVGKKIRAAALTKVPYTLVVGAKEAASDAVAPRIRADLGEVEPTLPFSEFVTKVQDEIAQRATKTSLI